MTKKLILAALVAAPFLMLSLPASADEEQPETPDAADKSYFSDIRGDFRTRAMETIKRDFKARGQAGLDRLAEDAVQAICNRTDNKPPEGLRTLMEGDQLAAVQLPANGKYMGDWKKGERLAQRGRGFTWRDKASEVVGGNCYNCHQLSPKEPAYGTLGPSLMHYGKIRGNNAEMQKYVYSKIYNAKAFNLCSEMPRFGHVGALQEDAIRDLVALLLDPESPVNK